MQALITIVGTQTIDGKIDSIELTTTGTLEPSDSGWLLRYEESEATVMQGAVTIVRLENDKVVLERTGANASYLLLEKHKRHHSNYNTPYGTIDLGTYATEIKHNLTTHGGEIYFVYTLGFNGSVASEHTVHITVQEDLEHV